MENIEKAKKSGNVLTQTMDEEGNLVGVQQTVNFEDREVSEVESTQLRNELLISRANANTESVESVESVENP
jgi:hypothetical protein